MAADRASGSTSSDQGGDAAARAFATGPLPNFIELDSKRPKADESPVVKVANKLAGGETPEEACRELYEAWQACIQSRGYNECTHRERKKYYKCFDQHTSVLARIAGGKKGPKAQTNETD